MSSPVYVSDSSHRQATMTRTSVLFLLGCLSSLSTAAERVVTPGPDAEQAFKQAQPGDTFVLANGVYPDAKIVLHAVGTADKPITLKAQTSGEVVFTGTSSLRVSGDYVVVDGLVFRDVAGESEVLSLRTSSKNHAHHCRLTNCVVENDPTKAVAGESKWLSIYGTENRVDHCSFSGKTDGGTLLVVWIGATSGKHRIDHNLFGARPVLGKNGGEIIRVGDSKTSMQDELAVVEWNRFEDCDGEAEIVSNKSCGNVYRHNTFVKCSGALTLRHGNRCLVEGNVFLGEGKRGSGGVRIIGEDHRVLNNYFEGLTGDESRAAISFMNGVPDSPLSGYFQVQRATVAFNTIVNCKVPFAIGIDSEDGMLPPRQCVIADNVVVNDSEFLREHTPPLEWTWAGNLWQSKKPKADPPAGVRVIDVALNRAADGLLRPTSGSPAVDGASGKVDDVAADIDGEPRTGKADAGCDEFSGTVVARLEEYGPVWRAK
jgi:poly(beta-D-mannuronate) lyase